MKRSTQNLHGDLERTIKKLTTALGQHTSRLPNVYRFGIGKNALKNLAELLDPIDRSYVDRLHKIEDLAEKTLELRKILHTVLDDKETGEDLKVKLAKWIVVEWGGVDRKEGASKIDAYLDLVRQAEEWGDRSEANPGKFDHVARWSKYLAFRHPSRAAIYDARVAYSLNWLLRGERFAYRFRPLASLNSILNFLDHSAIVTASWLGWDGLRDVIKSDIAAREEGERARSRIGKEIHAHTLGSNETYPRYMDVLKRVAKNLYAEDMWGVTKVEMLLFGLATTDVPMEVMEALRTGDSRQRADQAPLRSNLPPPQTCSASEL